MADLVFYVLRCILVALPAAWLSLGVLDNILHPAINRDEVARVLAMASLSDYPEVEACVVHRRIGNTAVTLWLFRLIVVGELAATFLLWLAAAALAGAAWGVVDDNLARTLGLIGLLAFTGVWSAFLIGGQWFYYWYGAHGQQTHLLATLWGIASMAVLAA